MKSPIWILLNLLIDASKWCSASTHRDLKEIEMRVKHEGESFLTITLPRFCSDFEVALDRGFICSSDFLGFGRLKRKGPLPLFLKGLVSLVFDSSTGHLLPEPDVNAIYYIRQLTLFSKKVLKPCSIVRERRTYKKFLQTELDIQDWRSHVSTTLLTRFREVAALLYTPRLSGVNLLIQELRHVPRHGPGATAERLGANERYAIRNWHHRLETYFPSDYFCVPNPGARESLDEISYCELSTEQPVRVISVPKTQKSPRIIAIEPSCMQYAQQSILEVLVPALESSSFRGALGFSDQGPNRDRALLGSIDGSFATIDLSDASDRVHNDLVKLMLESLPDLHDAVQDCRSIKADVPSVGVIPLAKFASMGSALCFPMEAMVFLSIACISMMESLGLVVNARNLDRVLATVRIYGDDIIVPTDLAAGVVRFLELYGLKVNATKSFWTGKFRESCGRDCYAGVDVTPVYLRREVPSSLRDALAVVSFMSFRNGLYERGCWHSVKMIDRYLKAIAYFPVVLSTSAIIGRTSFLGYEASRYNKSLHRLECRGLVVRTRKRSDPLDGSAALMKFFLKRGTDPVFEKDHLQRAGRSVSVDIKTRWATPF